MVIAVLSKLDMRSLTRNLKSCGRTRRPKIEVGVPHAEEEDTLVPKMCETDSRNKTSARAENSAYSRGRGLTNVYS